MKKITIFIFLVISFLVIFAIISILLLARDVRAEQEIRLEMEGNTLVVSGVLERYPNVPDEIDKETAWEAIKEGKARYTASKEERYEFSFPIMKVFKIFPQRDIFYQNGKWDLMEIAPLVSTQKEGKNLIPMFFSIILPLVCIFIFTFSMKKQKAENKKFFFFYVCLIGVIIIAGVVNHFANLWVSGIIGVFIGVIAGIPLKADSFLTDGLPRIYAGMTVGATSGILSSFYGYLVFVLGACVLSYVLIYFLFRFLPKLHTDSAIQKPSLKI